MFVYLAEKTCKYHKVVLLILGNNPKSSDANFCVSLQKYVIRAVLHVNTVHNYEVSMLTSLLYAYSSVLQSSIWTRKYYIFCYKCTVWDSSFCAICITSIISKDFERGCCCHISTTLGGPLISYKSNQSMSAWVSESSNAASQWGNDNQSGLQSVSQPAREHFCLILGSISLLISVTAC